MVRQSGMPFTWNSGSQGVKTFSNDKALFSTFLLRFCLFGMGPSVPLGLLSLIKESRRTGGVSSTIVLSLMVH